MATMEIQNKEKYSSNKVIEKYTQQWELQKPEQSIFNLIKNELPDMKMLDIGIGTGRTTYHFAKHSKQYLGVDYSEQMIEFCKKHFADSLTNSTFQALDIRNLAILNPSKFDIILISFNSLDYIDHKKRLEAFKELRSLCNPDAYFIFSTHNINSVDQIFKFELRKNLIALVKTAYNRYKYKKINGGNLESIKKKDYITLNDGAHDFGLITYYSSPKTTLHQIESNGFKTLGVYDQFNGNKIDLKNIHLNNDNYLYYLCKAV